MPEGTYSTLKPPDGDPVFKQYVHGAHYYVYSPTPDSYSANKKASATIILPTSLKNKGTGYQRNAYIALGVTGAGGGVDCGIANKGNGWHPCSFDVAPELMVHYNAEYSEQNKEHSYVAPNTAKKAFIEIVPAAGGKSVTLTVRFMTANGTTVGNPFSKAIALDRTHTWDRFYRFASLVPETNTTANTDSTYMIGGKFTEAKLGTQNWGIAQSTVSHAWIMHHPRCQLLNQTSTGEEFRIDHWA